MTLGAYFIPCLRRHALALISRLHQTRVAHWAGAHAIHTHKSVTLACLLAGNTLGVQDGID
jgi:hypothetical protein